MSVLLRLSSIALVIFAAAEASAELFVLESGLEVRVPSTSEVLRVQPVEFAALLDAPEGVVRRLPFRLPNGPTITLVVERFTVFDAESDVYLVERNGRRKVTPIRQLLLRGTVEGIAGSRVVLAVLPDQAYGIISAGASTYYLQPYQLEQGTVVCFPSSAARHPAPWSCGQEDLTDQPPIAPMPPSQKGKQGGTDQQQAFVRTLPLTMEGDYDMYLDHGQNAAKAIAYAEAVTAASSDIYWRDVNARLRIARFELWTVVDPYPGTTSGTLLTQYRDRWRAQHAAVNRATSILLSGVNGIGGVAYVNVLCSKQNGYSVVGLNNNVNYPAAGYVWDTDVFSHELGHNIGSLHTHSCSWAPPIDSCYAAEQGNCFAGSKAVRGTIMSYCHLTASGTSLEFHPRVSALLSTRIESATCKELISSLSVVARADTTMCHGDTLMLTASIAGGTAPFGIAWSGIIVTNPNSTGAYAVITGPALYTVIVTDALGSTARDTIAVTTSGAQLSGGITAPQQVCSGERSTFFVNGIGGTAPYRYTWVVNGAQTANTTSTAEIVAKDSIHIAVLIRDNLNCSTFVSTHLTSFQRPTNSLAAPLAACVGDSTTVTAAPKLGKPPYSVEWFVNGKDGNEITTSITFPLLESSIVRCIVTDNNQCTDTSEITIRARATSIHFTPARVVVPDIPACNDFAALSVLVRNSGSDTAMLTAANGTVSTASIAGSEQPFVVEPGEQRSITLHVRLPLDVSVVDTLFIVDARCGWTYPLVVEGRRGTLVADPVGGINLGVVASCESGSDKSAVVHLRNGSQTSLTISSMYAQGVDTIIATYPIVVPGNATVSVPVQLRSITSSLMNIPALRVVYTSQGCEGTASVPVVVHIAPFELSVPAELDFGIRGIGAQQAVRTLTLVPALSTRLELLSITSVEVVGPFRTDLAVGTQMRGGRATVASVQVVTDEVVNHGRYDGELLIGVDSCSARYRVPLRVMVDHSVSVADEHHTEVTISVSSTDRVLRVHGVAACNVTIYDIHGRALFTTFFDGTDIPVPSFIKGVIAVVAECDGNRSARRIIALQ